MDQQTTRLERYPWGIAAVACLAAMFFWSANDASFPLTVEVAKANVGASEVFQRWHPAQLHPWDKLGKRLFLLCAIYGVGVMSLAGLGIRFAKSRKKSDLVVLLAVVMGWGSFFMSRHLIDDWRRFNQVTARMDDFEAAAQSLSERWPTKSLEVPGLGSVLVQKGRTSMAIQKVLNQPGYPTRLQPGIMMGQMLNGGIRFDLWPDVWIALEYHPNGTVPKVGDTEPGRVPRRIVSCQCIKDSWYLLRYANWPRGD
ncbi:MAG: hypothetical protein AB8G99_07470 [Planctomycetaceae bacterium]